MYRYTKSSIMGGGYTFMVERERIDAGAQETARSKFVTWIGSKNPENNNWHSLKEPEDVDDIPIGLPYYEKPTSE